MNASAELELEPAFVKLAALKVGGLVLAGDPLFNSRGRQLAALAVKHAVPAVHAVREFAEFGGLMSYGGSIKESHRQAGFYTGRVLKGEKPANLPVQQATKVELCINLKTPRRRSGSPFPTRWSAALTRSSNKTIDVREWHLSRYFRCPADVRFRGKADIVQSRPTSGRRIASHALGMYFGAAATRARALAAAKEALETWDFKTSSKSRR